jgi:3-phosphoshikimate 1-carboxyvinyltransferase
MPIASAQVKSAILIAGLYCDKETSVIQNYQSRDHTERMLKHFGCKIKFLENKIILKGRQPEAHDILVPGDISSAVYFIVAGLLTSDSKIEISNVGLNETRVGFLKVLEKMGANITIKLTGLRNEEPYGNIKVGSSKLKAIEIGPETIPSMVDEIPLLALAATQANGTTIIRGAQELRFKESDRLNGIATQLNRLGAAVIEKPDGLQITGPTPLKGATVDSFGDHRLAMTLSIAGLIADGETIIKNAESVAISFPEFFDKLRKLHG